MNLELRAVFASVSWLAAVAAAQGIVGWGVLTALAIGAWFFPEDE